MERDRQPGLPDGPLAASSCLNCDAPGALQFCAHCGQKVEPTLRPVRDWLHEGLESFFSLDARWVRSLGVLLTRPGELTIQFLAGKRERYTHPLRLYVVTSAVAIAVMSLFGMLDLDQSFARMGPTEAAQLERIGLDVADPLVRQRFSDRFNAIFPAINLLSPIGFALALKAVLPRRYFQEHLLYGLHLATYVVLVSFLLVPTRGWAQAAAAVAIGAISLVYSYKGLRRLHPEARRGPFLARHLTFFVLSFAFTNALGLLAFFVVLATI